MRKSKAAPLTFQFLVFAKKKLHEISSCFSTTARRAQKMSMCANVYPMAQRKQTDLDLSLFPPLYLFLFSAHPPKMQIGLHKPSVAIASSLLQTPQ
jgi:hypothetical protein